MSIVFVVLSLLVIFFIYEFGLLDVSLAPSKAVRNVAVPPSCINPPAYPQLIMQSAVICPGNYNYGIGIGASNVNLKCMSGAIFDGAFRVIGNGLEINGAFLNITVEECAFKRFLGSGISLVGQVGVSNPGKLSTILLKNISSTENIGNGLQINENTNQTDVIDGNYSNNLAGNGIYIVANYKDPLRYRVNPDAYPK